MENYQLDIYQLMELLTSAQVAQLVGLTVVNVQENREEAELDFTGGIRLTVPLNAQMDALL